MIELKCKKNKTVIFCLYFVNTNRC